MFTLTHRTLVLALVFYAAGPTPSFGAKARVTAIKGTVHVRRSVSTDRAVLDSSFTYVDKTSLLVDVGGVVEVEYFDNTIGGRSTLKSLQSYFLVSARTSTPPCGDGSQRGTYQFAATGPKELTIDILADKLAWLEGECLEFVPGHEHTRGVTSRLRPLEPENSDPITALLHEAQRHETLDQPKQAIEAYHKLELRLGTSAWIERRVDALRDRSRMLDRRALPRAQTGPKVRALVVGVSEYLWAPRILGAAQDAHYFAQYLESGPNPVSKVDLLLDEDATVEAVRMKLRELSEDVRLGDTVYVYLAAHGVAYGTRYGFIVGYDSRPDVASTLLSMDELTQTLQDLEHFGAHVVVIADICHAGLLSRRNPANRSFRSYVSDISGLLSSGGSELSFEMSKLPDHDHFHGLFTYFLIDSLSLRESEVPATLTSGEVLQRVKQGLSRESQTNHQIHQTPVLLGKGDLALTNLRHKDVPRHTYTARPEMTVFDGPTAERKAKDILSNQPTEQTGEGATLLLSWQRSVDELELAIERQAQQTVLRYLAGDEIAMRESDFILASRLFLAAQLLHPDDDSLQIRADFCTARAAIYHGEFASAIKTLSRIIDLDPFRSYLYNARGVALLEQGGRLASAKDDFETAILLDPYWAYPRHNLGLAYVAEGNDEHARTVYQDAIAVAKTYGLGFGSLHHNLGLIFEREMNWDDAAAEFRQAIESFSRQSGQLIEWASQPANLTPIRQAWAESRRLAISLSQAEAHNSLGGMFAIQGRYGGALREYMETIRIAPSLVSAHYNLGNLLLKQGKRRETTYDQAIQQFEFVRAATEKDSGLHLGSILGLAQCYLNRAQLANNTKTHTDGERAQAYFDQVLALNPTVAAAIEGTLQIGELMRKAVR